MLRPGWGARNFNARPPCAPPPRLRQSQTFSAKTRFRGRRRHGSAREGLRSQKPQEPHAGASAGPRLWAARGGARVRAQRSGWVLLWLLPKRALPGFSPGGSSNPSPLPQGPQAPGIARAQRPRVSPQNHPCRSPQVVVKLAHRKGLLETEKLYEIKTSSGEPGCSRIPGATRPKDAPKLQSSRRRTPVTFGVHSGRVTHPPSG